MNSSKLAVAIASLLVALLTAGQPSPERLLAEDAALATPVDLALISGKTSTVFRGVEQQSGFNLHSYLAVHRGRLWAMWSSSKVGEEDPDQLIRYATSADGHRWSKAEVLVGDPDGPDQPKRWIARGLYVDEGRLTALAALIDRAAYRDRGIGDVWGDLKLMRFVRKGEVWSPKGVFADDCMNNFPPVKLGSSFVMPCRDHGMNMFVALAEHPGPRTWKRIPLGAEPPFHRMDEPTLYSTGDDVAHLVIRDGARSGFLLRSISTDRGLTWSRPVRTNYPDATSKNFIARLSNGTYFLINNPHPKRRDPLAISTSRDGWTFSRPLAIRKGLPPRRFPGRAKGSGTAQYPHAVEHRGSLWVIYSTNKEDIEITEIPLAVLSQP